MLILTRKNGEQIVIANRAGEVTTTITVTSIGGVCVKLGIDAARDVVVHRAEIYERIHGELPTVLQDAEPEGGHDAQIYERLPHPAVRMSPLPHPIEILNGDAIQR